MSKNSKRNKKKPQLSSQSNRDANQENLAREIEKKRSYLVNSLVLLTLVAVLLHMTTSALYMSDQEAELKSLRDSIYPLVMGLMIASQIFTITWFRRVIKSKTVEEYQRSNNVLRYKGILIFLVLTLMSYPLVKLSGVVGLISAQLTGLLGLIPIEFKESIEVFLNWFVSGISGWIGNILLGAMGSGLWSQIEKRKRKK
ncbi:hypothetical protein [Vibrio parahaemolyticus]|uniref:hypothetical protein n=1 Tax=Vibrio parahaemolyticus TaxID=670 RepID=UPI00084A4924|nr:hypothetical protein [Vibrio parahaemolyticus]ODX65770.1 hypothetical protein BBM09_07485 [Vibrio parahaemolyticus]